MRTLTHAEIDTVAGGYYRTASFCSTPNLPQNTSPLTQAGTFFANLHRSVENFLTSAGINSIPGVRQFDTAIVHPFLWNPITAITGVQIVNPPLK